MTLDELALRLAKYDGYSQWFYRLWNVEHRLMNGRALVAWNLRRIRVEKGLSQERLAFDTGIDRAYVGGLERREENPTVDLLDRLAEKLDVALGEFFVEPPSGAKPPKPLKGGRRTSK